MDTKINGSISSRCMMHIDDKGYVAGFGITSPKPTPAQQFQTMIGQSILDEVEPQVQKAREDMEQGIVLKLEQMGINPSMTSLHSFARSIADQYREQLVGKRIKEIVDGLLVWPQPTKEVP